MYLDDGFLSGPYQKWAVFLSFANGKISLFQKEKKNSCLIWILAKISVVNGMLLHYLGMEKSPTCLAFLIWVEWLCSSNLMIYFGENLLLRWQVIFYAWSITILGPTYGSVQVWWDAVVCMLLGNINVLRNFEEKVSVDIPWRNVNEILVVAWSRRVVLFPMPMKYFPKKKKYSYNINSKMIDVKLLGFGSWYMVAKFRYR